MHRVLLFCLVWFGGIAAGAAHAATEHEILRNSRVAAIQYTVSPGEILALDAARPAVTVYLASGTFTNGDPLAGGKVKVERGEAAFSRGGVEMLHNGPDSELRFVRVEFLGAGSNEVWGTAGLPPADKVLIENRYARVYDIRVPAGATEPRHTHHDRVVICLSGAQLKHVLPDGKEETATLETGEIGWRPGATHVGHNLGNTDLWVIAVEPK